MKPCTPGRQLLEAKAKPVQRLKHPKGPLAAPPCLHPTGALEMAHRHEETASPASAWSSQPSQVFRPGPGSLRVPVYPTSQCLEGPKSQPATCLVLAGGNHRGLDNQRRNHACLPQRTARKHSVNPYLDGEARHRRAGSASARWLAAFRRPVAPQLRRV